MLNRCQAMNQKITNRLISYNNLIDTSPLIKT